MTSDSGVVDLDSLMAVTEDLVDWQSDRERCEQSLHQFCVDAWKVVEPRVEFVDNWHIELLCDLLEKLTRGELYWTNPETGEESLTTDLLANIPPGCMKSLAVSVFWPCWTWIHQPESRWMFASYSSTLSTRDSLKRRSIIQSQWYQSQWPLRFIGDQNQKTRFENEHTGWMYATSVGGGGTGEHVDYLVIDDPTNAEQASSNQERENANDWWKGTVSSRGVARNVKRVVIMQRLHHEDLSGTLLEEGGWFHLKLPMRFVPGRSSPEDLDPRQDPGELLFPDVFTDARVTRLELRLGAAGAAGQLQQEPPQHFMGYEWPDSYFSESVWFDSMPSPEQIVWRVMATDPSLGNTSQSDYSAIIQVALDLHGCMWIDADLERRPPAQIVDDAFEIGRIFNPQSFVVETNGFQSLLEPMVADKGRQAGFLLPFTHVVNVENKDQRIRTTLNYYLAKGLFRFRRGSRGAELLVQQLKGFPSDKMKKDGPDALAMAVREVNRLWSESHGGTDDDDDYVAA